jgi:hypothetical protein
MVVTLTEVVNVSLTGSPMVHAIDPPGDDVKPPLFETIVGVTVCALIEKTERQKKIE